MSPRVEIAYEWLPVSFPELIVKIGGGTSFSVDQLVSMLAAHEKKGEDFHLVHQGVHFSVSLEKIQNYFKDHARPVPRMTQKQELEYLRKKVAELESERTGQMDAMEPPPEMASRFEMPAVSTLPPLRDDGIPGRDKQTPEDIRAELKKDLEKNQPLNRRSPTVRKVMAEDKL